MEKIPLKCFSIGDDVEKIPLYIFVNILIIIFWFVFKYSEWEIHCSIATVKTDETYIVKVINSLT